MSTEPTREKANVAASSIDKPPIELPEQARFVDGTQLNSHAGGIVSDGGTYTAISRPELVPYARTSTRNPDRGWTVPANRAGRVTILDHNQSQPTTYGSELEAVHLNPDGSYATLPTDHLLQVCELYSFMTESGTPPTDDPEVLRRNYWDMLGSMVHTAEQYGHYLAAIGVFGQRSPTPDQLNPSPYVRRVMQDMGARTGFSTTEMFRTGGAQSHTGMSNTRVAIQVAEAMQYLNPLLMTPTLCGPRVEGGIAGSLARMHGFTPKQLEHIQNMGVVPDDFSGPYQSWRYLLRRLGSPSGGIWLQPTPDTLPEYLRYAHDKLARGEINTPDRANGWHTDRLRLVLDGKGKANTIESCADDPALGNPNVIVPLQLLKSGIVSALEKMGLRGEDPREAVAKKLGIDGLSRAGRLAVAHHASLREASRYGNESRIYNQLPGEWLGTLLAIADTAPFLRIGDADRTRLRRMYATAEQSRGELQAWCTEHHANAPNAYAYFKLGLNNGAFYMNVVGNAYRETHPGATSGEVVRATELNAAKALHHAVHLVKAKS